MIGAALLAPAPAWAATQPPPRTLVSSVPATAPGFNGPVWTTAYGGGTVYVGGEFTHALVGGARIPRAGLAAIDTRTGELLDWAPAADGLVTAIVTHGRDVFIAGRFDHINGVARDSLARVDGITGAVREGWDHLIWGSPSALEVGHGRLYLGGMISRAGQHERQGLVAFDLATGEVDERWAPTANGRVEAIQVAGGRVYLAGRFWKINDVPGSRRVAAVHPVTGELDPGFRAEDAEERAYGMAVGPHGVYVAHGGLGGRIRAYEHTGRTQWELTTDGDPVAVARLDDVVYFGGHFDEVCHSARLGDHGACLDGSVERVKLGAASRHDGTLLPWRADGNGVVGVRVIGADPHWTGVAVGGEFTTVNGADRRRFALFPRAGG